MKINFNRTALHEALGLVTSVVPSRTPKPVLKSVHIAATEEGVRISATDLETGINYNISQAEATELGETVVPADRFAAIVRESTDEVIHLESSDAGCQIKGADSQYTIYTQDPRQYPAVPDFDGKAELEINLAKLREGIELCLFSAARESTRYALNGVLWEVKSKKLMLVATDGRRLARSKVDIASKATGEFSSKGVIVPAKTMALLEKVGGDEKETVGVRLAGNQILLRCGCVVVSSNLVEGNFPQYEDIIPAGYEKKLRLDTQATLSAVRRAALLTNEDSRGVKMSISKDSLVFSSRAPEMGDAQIEMAVEYKGEAMEVAFNPQFLIDVLRVVKSDEFELELGQPDRPGLFKSGANFLYVVMPINLS
jgi:DNA polymerase-3 subunit beta